MSAVILLKNHVKEIYNWLLRLKYNVYSNIEVGNNTLIRYAQIKPYVKIGKYCNIQGGAYDSYTYLGDHCELPQTKIGKFCSIAGHVILAAGNHPMHYISTSPYTYSNIKDSFVEEALFENEFFYTDSSEQYLCDIGNDVWIGTSAILVCGNKALHIGDGAVIAAGSVVIDDVPPYAVVAGCPAKVVKYRFSKEEIDKLLKIK